jgi:exonuclease III
MSSNLLRRLIPVSALALLATAAGARAAENPSVEIMFYNVENLFDTAHAEGKADFEYTPQGTPGKIEGCNKITIKFYRENCLQSDWTEAGLRVKLAQIKRMLTEGRAQAPDILALTEIENLTVASMLAREAGYDFVRITDSPDERGIDVALLARTSADVRVDAVHEHVPPFAEIEPQFKSADAAWEARHILEAELTLFGTEKVYLLATHWPSQYYPSEYRAWYAAKTRELIDARRKSDPTARVILGGDFNTATGELPDPADGLRANGPAWTGLLELDPAARHSNHVSTVAALSPGSYYFPKTAQWNLLDRVFFTDTLDERDAKNPVRVSLSSYEIRRPEFAAQPEPIAGTKYHAPFRYNFRALDPAKAGFSDHFPITFRVEKADSAGAPSAQ